MAWLPIVFIFGDTTVSLVYLYLFIAPLLTHLKQISTHSSEEANKCQSKDLVSSPKPGGMSPTHVLKRVGTSLDVNADRLRRKEKLLSVARSNLVKTVICVVSIFCFIIVLVLSGNVWPEDVGLFNFTMFLASLSTWPVSCP